MKKTRDMVMGETPPPHATSNEPQKPFKGG